MFLPAFPSTFRLCSCLSGGLGSLDEAGYGDVVGIM
jgi:hypothetical protein